MASREQNEAVAGLLRRSLARDAAGDMCPEPDLLAGYFEHSLDEGETSRFEGHLSTCSRCRAQLAAMVRADAPKPQSKSFWLFDWRLLSAAALVMVLVTVWFARRPGRVEPMPQTQDAPLVAMSKEAPKSDYSPAEPQGSPAAHSARTGAALKQIKPAPVAPPAVPVPGSFVAERIGEKKALERDSRATSELTDSTGGAHINKQVETRSAAPGGVQAAPDAVGGSAGSQVAPPRNARTARVMPAPQQQQPQQLQQQQPPISASSQMVRVEPGPPPAPGTRPPQKANAAATDVAAQTETVEAAAGAEAGKVTDDKHKSESIANAYLTGNETSLQTLEERTNEKLIETPIPAIKWRITSAGFVERSEDGGATWSGQEPGPDAHLIAGSAPSDKVCWLVGKQGIVLVTKDGANWKKVPPPADADITSVSAKSASAATVTTADGRKFTTHNEGKKWKPVE